MPTPTPQQRKKLRDALISAFPEKSSLEQLLDFELDRKVNQITQDSNLQTVVYKLIERAQAEGWLVELVRAARKENPGNSELAAIALELLSPETSSIPKSSPSVSVTVTQSKQEQSIEDSFNITTEFDVFLAHNNQDKLQVRKIAQELKRLSLKPWLDEEQIPPGRPFQDVIQQAIPLVKSAAIFIGLDGLGRWQSWELRSLISQCVERKIPVIPVLLPGVKQIPEELIFLKEFRWVSFSQRIDDDHALDLLQWGITFKKPEQVVENERPGQIPTKSADVKQIRFISELRTRLIIEKQVHDLSRDEEFAEFDFIGFKQTSLTLDFVAFKKADELNERQIVQLCDKFFEITQMVSYDFRLKPVTRMPNSLLGLIFEDECPNYLIDFIKKQTKISHWGKSAVIVTWVIHVKQKQIYTHNNPVSLVPPVFIMEGSVFPGLDYLKSFLSA